MYKKTVRHLFPELLASRRAVFYGTTDKRLLMREDAAGLAAATEDLSPSLSHYLRGDAMKELLQTLLNLPSRREGKIKKIAKICLKGNPLFDIVRSFTARSFHVDMAAVIARALIIDGALKLLNGETQETDCLPLSQREPGH